MKLRATLSLRYQSRQSTKFLMRKVRTRVELCAEAKMIRCVLLLKSYKIFKSKETIEQEGIQVKEENKEADSSFGEEQLQHYDNMVRIYEDPSDEMADNFNKESNRQPNFSESIAELTLINCQRSNDYRSSSINEIENQYDQDNQIDKEESKEDPNQRFKTIASKAIFRTNRQIELLQKIQNSNSIDMKNAISCIKMKADYNKLFKENFDQNYECEGNEHNNPEINTLNNIKLAK